MSSKKNDKKKKNKKNLLKIQSCQDFSPIRDVCDGIIVTKDRRFVKIIEISPINFLLRSQEEQNMIISNFAAAIKAMPMKVQFKIISRKADVSGFVEKIKEQMSDEQNPNCLTLQREQIDLIKNVGTQEGISRRFFIIIEYEEPAGFQRSSTFNEIKSALNTSAMRIENMLISCGNEVIPLSDDEEILKVLYTIICKAESEEKAYELRKYEVISRYLGDDNFDASKDAYIPVNDFIMPKNIDTRESPKYIVIDGVYYSFAFIPSKSYSTTSVGGWFSIFLNLGEGVDVDLFCKKESIDIVQQKLVYALRFNKVKARGMEDTSTDYDDVRNAIDSGYYIKNGIANGQDFWYMGILLTISAHTRKDLEWKMQEIKMYLLSQDIRIKTCWFQMEDAFLMSLPICDFENNIFKKSRRNILTNSLASAYPFVAFEMSDENGILFGINKANNSLAFVDNFDSKKYQNANMAILGMSGAGKTYTLQCLAMRMREQKTQVFIIAPYKGNEFIRACEAIGGQYVKISSGSDQNINIMEIRKKDTTNLELINGDLVNSNSILANKIQQLHTFFTLLIPDISYEEKQLLDKALVETYKRFGITDDNDSLFADEEHTYYKPMPVLGDLHKVLEEGGEDVKHLYNMLSRFVSGSSNSFNKQTNVNLDNKYIVLDISELQKDQQAIGMFIVLDYVWDKAKEDPTAKKAIILDELWKLIGARGSVEAAEFVFEIFKLIRGYGGSAIAATQDLEDFFGLDDGRYGKAILNNAKIKILLKLEPQEARYVQEQFELSDVEVQRITSFKRGEGLLTANTNHVVVEFKSSPTEHALITTDRKELKEIADIKRKQKEQ